MVSLNIGDSDLYVLNELTGDVAVVNSKEKIIEVLKNTGIICTQSKKREEYKPEVIKTEDETRFVMNVTDKKYKKTLFDKLRNVGQLKKEDNIEFEIDDMHIGFLLSPRLKLLDLEGNKLAIRTELCDKEVLFETGDLILCEGLKEREVLDFFNSIIAFFNIFNVHFDFVHESETMDFADVTFKNGVKAKGVALFYSKKATTRGLGYKVLQLQIKDFMILLDTVNSVYQYVKTNDVLSAGDIHIFLGYGRYYHFHKDYLLAFSNTWMFIEATISLMWEKMMEDSGFNKKYLKGVERNWSAQGKIDVLLVKGLIDKKTNEDAQRLRSIRNNVFHVSKDVNKRKIDEKISEECVDLGLRLFYHNIDFLDPGYIISFDDIALAIEQCIEQSPYD